MGYWVFRAVRFRGMTGRSSGFQFSLVWWESPLPVFFFFFQVYCRLKALSWADGRTYVREAELFESLGSRLETTDLRNAIDWLVGQHIIVAEVSKSSHRTFLPQLWTHVNSRESRFKYITEPVAYYSQTEEGQNIYMLKSIHSAETGIAENVKKLFREHDYDTITPDRATEEDDVKTPKWDPHQVGKVLHYHSTP